MKKVFCLLFVVSSLVFVSVGEAKTTGECNSSGNSCKLLCEQAGTKSKEAEAQMPACMVDCDTQKSACLATAEPDSFGSSAAEESAAQAAQKAGPTTDYGYQKTAEESGLPNIGATVPGLLGKFIKAALGLVATIFFALMIYGGFLWMTAAGAGEQVGQAKKLITNAILGVVLIASAYAITQFVLDAVS